MEDILSSIKRIIAEENDAAPARAKRPARALPARSEPTPYSDDEILELSQPAPELDRRPQPEPQPQSPRIARAAAAREEPAPEPVRAPAPVAAKPEPEAAAPDSIVSPRTAEASRGPLDVLSRLVVKPEVSGSDTLEGMVRDMLRPMLRDWLDANLPAIVEAMVAKEIERITGK
jgi:cell pole-organizing protein PopZ